MLKDFALQNPTAEQLRYCLATLSHFCHEQQTDEIFGWYPKLAKLGEPTVQHTVDNMDGYYYCDRKTEIAMIKSLIQSDDNNTSAEVLINHLDTIRHVDHV